MEMEIPVIKRISDLDVGISSIKDPSLSSRVFAVPEIGKLHKVYSFFKWSALIIAFLASLTTLITKIKLLILKLRKIESSTTSLPLLDDYDSESDVSCSSSHEEDSEEEEDDDEQEDSSSRWRRIDDDFHVKGSRYYLDDNRGLNQNFTWRRRPSGSFGDLISRPDLDGLGGSSVVKLWNHLDLDGDEQSVVASSLGKCGGASVSPAVFLAAKKSGTDAMKLRVWDTRSGFRMPALLAEWRQPGRLLGKIVGLDAGGVEKIYVRDDFSGGITVGDMRRLNGALTDPTGSDVETWWDADAVMVPDGPVDQTR